MARRIVAKIYWTRSEQAVVEWVGKDLNHTQVVDICADAISQLEDIRNKSIDAIGK